MENEPHTFNCGFKYTLKISETNKDSTQSKNSIKGQTHLFYYNLRILYISYIYINNNTFVLLIPNDHYNNADWWYNAQYKCIFPWERFQNGFRSVRMMTAPCCGILMSRVPDVVNMYALQFCSLFWWNLMVSAMVCFQDSAHVAAFLWKLTPTGTSTL